MESIIRYVLCIIRIYPILYASVYSIVYQSILLFSNMCKTFRDVVRGAMCYDFIWIPSWDHPVTLERYREH